MAKREKRKTSLGNALEANSMQDEARSSPSTRWRSASEPSAPAPRPKLFWSVRDAMEFEATEQEIQRQAGVSRGTTTILDARTLSTLEKTQADQAGYTVIRRRAISESVAHPLPRSRDAPDRRRGKTNKSGLTTTPSDRRPSKRAPTERKPSATTANSAWASSSHPPSLEATPLPEDTDAQRWLAAASAGAIVPATATPEPPPSAPWLPVSESAPAIAAKVPEAAAAVALDENMLSWLESALSLDETRASLPHISGARDAHVADESL